MAAFAAQGMVRSVDSLLPQIAADFGTTVGAASIVITAYALTHGSIQFVVGPVADRLGKYVSVAIACALSALTVLSCGLAQSLDMLALARFTCGLTAAGIVPIGLAYVGDVVPYEARQQVLGRFLAGQVLGQMFGQAAGGVIGDFFGWRTVFFVLTGIFAVAAAALFFEFAVNPRTRPDPGAPKALGLRAAYRAVLSNPWARIVLLVTFIESMLLFSVFPFVGADLHLRFGLSFTGVGLVIGFFAIGGLALRGVGQAPDAAARPDRPRHRRRPRDGRGLPHARRRAGVVVRPARRVRDRFRLLHDAQHAADRKHADVVGGARHRGRDVRLGVLSWTDRGRAARRRWSTGSARRCCS